MRLTLFEGLHQFCHLVSCLTDPTCAATPVPCGPAPSTALPLQLLADCQAFSLPSACCFLVFTCHFLSLFCHSCHKVSLSFRPRSSAFSCVFHPLAFLMLPCFSYILAFSAITLSKVFFVFFLVLWHIEALTLFGSKLSGDRTVTFRNASLSFLCKHNYTVAAVVPFLPLLLPPFKDRGQKGWTPPPPQHSNIRHYWLKILK